MENRSQLDIIALFLFIVITSLGIASVYSATMNDTIFSLFDGRSGKQLVWFGISLFLGIIIFLLNANFFELFRLFGFIQETSDQNTNGIGLGLMITKHIIYQYNGDIWVDSVPGTGSTFSLKLKLIQED